jgi:hypothetical protein
MTTVGIDGAHFIVDGAPANQGRVLPDPSGAIPLDGLLLNSRMINGAFDDLNAETRVMWAYPDTGVWDPDRNTAEFIAAMAQWKADGLDAFTLGIQGGSPQGYSVEQPWDNPGFDADGVLLKAYAERLARIIDVADRLGLVVILDLFYHGQERHLRDEDVIRTAVVNACAWVLDRGWRNVLIEIANEVNIPSHYTQHAILRGPRIHELVALAQSVVVDGRRLLVGSSFAAIPPYGTPEMAATADFMLVHGNGTSYPERLAEMVTEVRALAGYRGQPVIFNEDDHFDFDVDLNHMRVALRAGASWGFFDPGSVTVFPPKPTLGDYGRGYQAVPVNWGVTTPTKAGFFATLRTVRAARG